MHQFLPSLLLPEYRRRVLGLLLLRPDLALHGREIARQAGLSAGTITRELTNLADAGLLKRERRGNQQVNSADTNSPIFTGWPASCARHPAWPTYSFERWHPSHQSFAWPSFSDRWRRVGRLLAATSI